MKKHIEGYISNNGWSGEVTIGGTDFTDIMYSFADEVGFAKRHNKNLGGKKAFIDDCNMRMYFMNEECDLDEAETALLMKLDGAGFFDDHDMKETLYGDFELLTNYVGYSEWTITGLNVEKCTLGGHNLIDILNSHNGEYVHIIIEVPGW